MTLDEAVRPSAGKIAEAMDFADQMSSLKDDLNLFEQCVITLVAALRAEQAKSRDMREALEPFAKMADVLDALSVDQYEVIATADGMFGITHADCIRARAAHSMEQSG
jgi:hypothetical protein